MKLLLHVALILQPRAEKDTSFSPPICLNSAYSGTDNHYRPIQGSNGFRLPFEYEWQFAAEGEETYKFVESREGASPSPAHRTVRETLASYGSYHST